ncbi:MAG TPA: hypothetical protein VGC76_13940 [Pyrinomonadaceae bacterium]|jgi:hypothetical protein
MSDQSDLDTKYFIDKRVYNCPFCNRRNVLYVLDYPHKFDWSNNKVCYAYFAICTSCSKTSMHLSFSDLSVETDRRHFFYENVNIDSEIFYSVPTSFFVIDERIPRVIRELITEAEGCVKMNFLTGASACTRKAIYELTIIEKAEGENYEERIKFLKTKFPQIDSQLFDVLSHIKDMTSDKVHEQSWDKWDNQHLKLFLETLKVILHEIYVVPDERKKRSLSISSLLPTVFKDKDARRSGAAVSNEQETSSES